MAVARQEVPEVGEAGRQGHRPTSRKRRSQLAKETHFAKFDETVELHLRTGLDPRHADQQIRGTTLLPHGLGKTVRVLVFAEGEAARSARRRPAPISSAATT